MSPQDLAQMAPPSSTVRLTLSPTFKRAIPINAASSIRRWELPILAVVFVTLLNYVVQATLASDAGKRRWQATLASRAADRFPTVSRLAEAVPRADAANEDQDAGLDYRVLPTHRTVPSRTLKNMARRSSPCRYACEKTEANQQPADHSGPKLSRGHGRFHGRQLSYEPLALAARSSKRWRRFRAVWLVGLWLRTS